MHKGLVLVCSAAMVAALGLSSHLTAQTVGTKRKMIREKIDESKLVRLSHNTRPEANAANDRGAVADDFELDHMLLQLKRSPESEAALLKLIADQQDPNSPLFHQWLTPDQFAQNYGASTQDVQTVTAWLEGHGFTVNGVQAS